MTTIRAKQIQDALQRARKVGVIEEAVTIAGCPLVLQTLSPEDYPAIVQELEDAPEEEYMFQFQLHNVSRSLVEVDGQDLRDVAFIEDDVPAGAHLIVLQLPTETAARKVQQRLRDELKLKAAVVPPNPKEVRSIKVPRHEWVRNNILRTWGYEAVAVAWRKFSELRIQADEAAKSGIKFQIPDETPEDKLRRLLIDIQDAAGELPDDMLDRILGEAGLLRKASQEELQAAEAQLAQVAQQQQAPEAPTQPRRRSIAEIAAEAEEESDSASVAVAQKAPAAVTASPEELMRNRTPLNQQVSDVPVPPPSAYPAPAQKRVPVPEHIRKAALDNTSGVNSSMTEAPVLRGRAAEAAALEMAALNESGIGADPIDTGAHSTSVASESPPIKLTPTQVDGKELVQIINQPPVAGVNPRFRRQP